MSNTVIDRRSVQATPAGLPVARTLTLSSSQGAPTDSFSRLELCPEAEDPRSGIFARPVLWRDRDNRPIRLGALAYSITVAGAGAALLWGNPLRMTHASVWTRPLGEAAVSVQVSRLYLGGSAFCGASLGAYETIRGRPQVSHEQENRERAMQAQTLWAVTGSISGALLGAVVTNGLQKTAGEQAADAPNTQAVVLRLIVAVLAGTTVGIVCFKMNHAGQQARRTLRDMS